MRVRSRLHWLPWMSLWIAGAAFAQGPAGWWLGFVDTRGHAFLELPGDAHLCEARTAAITRLPAPAPGTLVLGAIKAASYLPPGAHLTFGVTDLGGRYGERVLPRVAAIVRDDEARKGPCWLLAEAGTEAAGYVAEEDRLAFGTYPPRPLTVRQAPEDWQSYGGTSGAAATDARFNPIQGLPQAWRERVALLLPGFTQVYGQSFSAVLTAGGKPQALSLIGAINDGSRTAGEAPAYNTLNLILRAGEERPLYQAGPSGGVAQNRAGSFVAQAVAAVDLDGDGIDEIILRARYYEGGNLKVLKLVAGQLVEIRQSAYEGD
jgi:hypothetical protein